MSKKYWDKYNCTDKSEEVKMADLFQACKDGRLNVVKILLEKGSVDPNKIPEKELSCQGLTALHVAVRHDKLDCVQYLIKVGADVDATDKFGFRSIHDAALNGSLSCLKELLGHSALLTGVQRKGFEHITPLFYAIQQNHVECIQLLKQRTHSSDCLVWDLGSKRGYSSLTKLSCLEEVPKEHVANWIKNSALSGYITYLSQLKELVSRNFDSKETLNSLLTCTQHGHEDYLRYLLTEGADPNLCNEENVTALHYAARYDHVECINALVQHGADVNTKTSSNLSPLHVALQQCSTDAVEKLIEHGCDINLTGGQFNDTAVHMALKLPVDEPTMKAILAGCPTLAMQNDEGKLPTDIVSDFPKLNELVNEYARN